MLLVIEILLLALTVMALFPELPIGKALRFWLIETPAEALGRLSPARLAIVLIVVAGLIAFAALAPEMTAMMGIGDLFAYLDAMVIAAVVAAAARMRPGRAAATLRRSLTTVGPAMRRLTRSAGRRLRNRRPRLPPSADDLPPRAGWALA